MAKYDVWGRVGKTRKRLRGGFASESDARRVRDELGRAGIGDLVVVQRPPSYGRIRGLQKRGLQLEKKAPERQAAKKR
jgi:hypothetical protein